MVLSTNETSIRRTRCYLLLEQIIQGDFNASASCATTSAVKQRLRMMLVMVSLLTVSHLFLHAYRELGGSTKVIRVRPALVDTTDIS